MPNGHIHKDETEDFEQKTGWAPRFGQGSITEEEAGVSLLDHSTLLESKLDDKFFGGKASLFFRLSYPSYSTSDLI